MMRVGRWRLSSMRRAFAGGGVEVILPDQLVWIGERVGLESKRARFLRRVPVRVRAAAEEDAQHKKQKMAPDAPTDTRRESTAWRRTSRPGRGRTADGPPSAAARQGLRHGIAQGTPRAGDVLRTR